MDRNFALEGDLGRISSKVNRIEMMMEMLVAKEMGTPVEKVCEMYADDFQSAPWVGQISEGG